MTARLRKSLSKAAALSRARQDAAVRAAFQRAGVPWEPRRVMKHFPRRVGLLLFRVSTPLNVCSSRLLICEPDGPPGGEPIEITRRQALAFLRVLNPAEDGQPFPPRAVS